MNPTGLAAGPRARQGAYRALAHAFAPPNGGRAGPVGRGRAAEYTRLFVAPRPIVYPYESMYEPAPRVMGETTLAVEQCYAASGFPAPEWRDLPDHVALELHFMAWLAGEESAARLRREPWRLARTLHLELTFLQDHLIRWIPRFSEAVGVSTRLVFYRTMAERLRQWIPWDLDVVLARTAAMSGAA